MKKKMNKREHHFVTVTSRHKPEVINYVTLWTIPCKVESTRANGK